ncbi:MAG: glycerophosphodiester phosphodiesterase family protein [Pseudomonadota bacterium]
MKLPQIIGHSGAAGYAPENTLESIHTAADMGIEWVELDVKITKDEIPIIFHDDELDRVSNGSGNIADKTLEELRELEVGSWFGESFAGIKIPTLEEALEVLIDRDLGFNMEIKPCPAREKVTAEAALDVLSHFWDDHDHLLISSFQHIALEIAQEMAPDWHRGLLLEEHWPDNWTELAEYLKVSSLNVNQASCTPETMDELLALSLPVLAYTVNDPDRARELQSLGVTGIFSDEPDDVKDGILTVH